MSTLIPQIASSLTQGNRWSNSGIDRPETPAVLKHRLWTGKRKIVYSIPLEDLRGTIIDLTPHYSAENYRFIDADAFTKDRQLIVYEVPLLPKAPMTYTVTSYVWYGLNASPSQLEHDGSFRVFCGTKSDGTHREDGGPINLKVLEYICRWACVSSSFLVWLDRLCILQTSEQDKAWQISRMHGIFESSEQCIVLPGGLQRLASTSEVTSWVDRAWTYQEAMTTWDYAVVFTSDQYHLYDGPSRWFVEGECYYKPLVDLFVEASHLVDSDTPYLVLGGNAAGLNLLGTIMEYKTLNEVAPEEERISQDVIDQLVIQGVGVRTSSRPVDMVLSILGLLGADNILGPDKLQEFGSMERFRATLALVEAVFIPYEDKMKLPVLERGSRMLDIPLWQALEITTTNVGGDGLDDDLAGTMLPTLRDLTDLLDGDATEITLSHHPIVSMKRTPLPEWKFGYGAEVNSASGRAAAIANEIPDSEFIRSYSVSENERVLVRHKDEGWIELCQTLGQSQSSEYLEDDIVLGWTLKLGEHPCIRFYRFVTSHIVIDQD
ncbi:hypothetical protein VNI00_014094 [Paramarasmius palmivorus]|uniref:Heterokaryon incompatibility domain-containing protein n=1 Tax=Paramarasmius palmivorus TaxID=297713 RepID=A0AAW0BWT0_9AGAR